VYQEERSKELLAAPARGGAGDTGLALVLVSIGEDAATVRRYATTTRVVELPVFVDPGFAVTEQYRISGLPTHYFIGRDGVIRDLAVGGLKPNGMRARLAKILQD
jgi:cytochrome c biogenesis protein CcmG, thiol:disulfide interchange protein DsbE